MSKINKLASSDKRLTNIVTDEMVGAAGKALFKQAGVFVAPDAVRAALWAAFDAYSRPRMDSSPSFPGNTTKFDDPAPDDREPPSR
jgi:hypothetical protein